MSWACALGSRLLGYTSQVLGTLLYALAKLWRVAVVCEFNYYLSLLLSCRRSRRILFSSRFLFFLSSYTSVANGCVLFLLRSYPAGGPAGSCILLVSSFFFFFLLLLLLLLLIQAHAMRMYSVSLKFFLPSTMLSNVSPNCINQF